MLELAPGEGSNLGYGSAMDGTTVDFEALGIYRHPSKTDMISAQLGPYPHSIKDAYRSWYKITRPRAKSLSKTPHHGYDVIQQPGAIPKSYGL